MIAPVFIATSLDGFIARENGEIDWLEEGDERVAPDSENEDYGFDAFFNSVDVLIMGRNSFQKVLSFGQWLYGDKRVIVLSSTMNEIPDDVPDTVELKNCSPVDLYNELEDSGFENLYIDGGKTIQGFLDADLIHEVVITKIPILIGSGIPLFGPLTDDKKLRHIETLSFENGFIQSKYEVIR